MAVNYCRTVRVVSLLGGGSCGEMSKIVGGNRCKICVFKNARCRHGNPHLQSHLYRLGEISEYCIPIEACGMRQSTEEAGRCGRYAAISIGRYELELTRHDFQFSYCVNNAHHTVLVHFLYCAPLRCIGLDLYEYQSPQVPAYGPPETHSSSPALLNFLVICTNERNMWHIP